MEHLANRNISLRRNSRHQSFITNKGKKPTPEECLTWPQPDIKSGPESRDRSEWQASDFPNQSFKK